MWSIVKLAEKNPRSKVLDNLAAVMFILSLCLAPFWFFSSLSVLLWLADTIGCFVTGTAKDFHPDLLIAILAWMALMDACPIFWFLIRKDD